MDLLGRYQEAGSNPNGNLTCMRQSPLDVLPAAYLDLPDSESPTARKGLLIVSPCLQAFLRRVRIATLH